MKYGFDIRSLIEHNRLPSWKFSSHDCNQIVYKSSQTFASNKIHSNLSAIRPLSLSSPRKHPCSVISSIKQRWIHSLLNSNQSTDMSKQLLPVVHQSTQLLSTNSSSTVLRNLSTNKSSLKARIPKRTCCRTFDEHLQRYYQSKWCLIPSHID